RADTCRRPAGLNPDTQAPDNCRDELRPDVETGRATCFPAPSWHVALRDTEADTWGLTEQTWAVPEPLSPERDTVQRWATRAASGPASDTEQEQQSSYRDRGDEPCDDIQFYPS